MTSGFIDRGATHAQTHARLEAIIATAMDAIISVDEAQNIICFNPAAEAMFGIAAGQVMGAPVERFVPQRLRGQGSSPIKRFIDGEAASGRGCALRADGDEFPVEASLSQAQLGEGRMWTLILRDITDRKAHEEAQALLAREVDHRAKNILAIISSLVSLTQAPTREAYAESLSGRVDALARAHGLLSRSRWQSASLAQLAADELGTHAEPENFVCDGEELKLSSRAVQPIAMLIHELTTNAVKFGALSVSDGLVYLRWSRLADDRVELLWRETGGPPVTEPARKGFGSMLIQQIGESQLCGQIEHVWDRKGYRLKLTLPETVLQIGSEPGRAAPKGAGATGGMAERSEAGHAGTLLIVEDEPLLAMQMSKSLEEFGWSILGVAGSIEEANRLLADQKRPDAAILDVDLAGMPVFPLARSLRRLGIPFLFCTGYEDIGYVQEFADCRTIRKPATALQVVRGLRDVVRTTQEGLTSA